MAFEIKQVKIDQYHVVMGGEKRHLHQLENYSWSLSPLFETLEEWRKSEAETKTFANLRELEASDIRWAGITELIEPSKYVSPVFH